MRTTLCIQTRIRQPQPLDRTPMHQMFIHNLLHISYMNEPIPHRIGIDHYNRSMLALVKTAKLIRTNLPLQSRSLHRILEGRLKLPAAFVQATRTRSALVTLIRANKYVMLKLWQIQNPFQETVTRAREQVFLVRCTGVSETILIECNLTILSRSKTTWWPSSPATACVASTPM